MYIVAVILISVFVSVALVNINDKPDDENQNKDN